MYLKILHVINIFIICKYAFILVIGGGTLIYKKSWKGINQKPIIPITACYVVVVAWFKC